MSPADRRLLSRARAVRVALGLDVVLGILAALLVLAQAVLIGSIIAALFHGARLGSLTAPLVLLVAVAGGRASAGFGFEVVGRFATTHLVSEIRADIARTRLQSPFGANDRAADVATVAVEGTAALEGLFAQYLPQLVLAVVVPLAVLTVVARLDLVSASLMLITLPVAIVFMWLLGQTAAERNRERWQALKVLATHFSDVVHGLPTLRAFNRGAAQVGRIAEVSDEYRRTTMQTLRVSFMSAAVLDLAGTLGVALIAVTMGVRLVDGAINFAPALIVLLLAPELYAPLRNLGARYHASEEGRAVAGRLLDLAGEPQVITKIRAPSPRAVAVRFENAWYSYSSRDTVVLRAVNLALEPGETVALVGPSGAGKSTLAALLLLLARPSRGRVLAGDLDLFDCDPRSWRAQIAWVPQRATLFRSSIAANVRLGRADAPDDVVREVCRSVGADEFIQHLPSGYETLVGDGGRPLSAGERQRIALARALLRDAPLLILDEPTANLDESNARRVLSTLESERGRRTVMVITHRADVATIADRVVRIEDGRLLTAEADTWEVRSA